MQDICIFKRVEKKYPVDTQKKNMLLNAVSHRLVADAHGKSTVCSLYLDTPDRLLIRNSITATTYKEKLRLRSYGTPKSDTEIFFEIKKKYKGVVYKRRVKMPLSVAEEYIRTGKMPIKSQIMSEIDYTMRFYRSPMPSMLIAYEREAYFSKDDDGLRITFDTAIRYRDTELDMTVGSHGTEITDKDRWIMEIKTNGGMPIWLAEALDQCEIYPSRFSKYANAHLLTLKENNTREIKI